MMSLHSGLINYAESTGPDQAAGVPPPRPPPLAQDHYKNRRVRGDPAGAPAGAQWRHERGLVRGYIGPIENAPSRVGTRARDTMNSVGDPERAAGPEVRVSNPTSDQYLNSFNRSHEGSQATRRSRGRGHAGGRHSTSAPGRPAPWDGWWVDTGASDSIRESYGASRGRGRRGRGQADVSDGRRGRAAGRGPYTRPGASSESSSQRGSSTSAAPAAQYNAVGYNYDRDRNRDRQRGSSSSASTQRSPPWRREDWWQQSYGEDRSDRRARRDGDRRGDDSGHNTWSRDADR